MSRATSTQIIERGEYLERDFDPNSLTVPHLLSILTFHNVRYPTPHTKAKLVQTFNEEIAPRAVKYKRERLKREGSVASSHGITDGLTGESLSGDEPVREEPPAPRRSTRRLSRPPSVEPVARPDPPKRRRSSAGPTLLRAPAPKAEPQEPILVEESEPEDEPVKKVGRPRKSVAAAGPQARRVSQGEDVEGWSDNNIFQSGVDSSSPARPSPTRTTAARRPTRRGRTSLSAPPQVPSSSPFAAPSTAFEPQLPASLERGTLSPMSSPTQEGVRNRRKTELFRSSSPLVERVEEDDEQGAVGEDDIPESQKSLVDQVSSALASGGSGRAVARRLADVDGTPAWLRVLAGLLMLIASGMTVSYKQYSTSVGLCAPGSNTNAVIEHNLQERKAARAAADECQRLHSGDESSYNETCPSGDSLFEFLEPLDCTPCPDHAFCTPDTVTCDESFVLRPHPLAQVPLLPSIFNGLPGFGPVAFPPTCIVDERRKKLISKLAQVIELNLAVMRGNKLCINEDRLMPTGGEAALWGDEINQFREALRSKLTWTKRVAMEGFDSTFNEAVEELIRLGYIFTSESTTGEKYIAAHRVQLDFPCRLRVTARETWSEWKRFVTGAAFGAATLLFLRQKLVEKRAESRRVAELVHVALDTLRNQELAHHTDPVTAPYPYLPSMHLRDLVLQDEHSIPARRSLWNKVERVVEGNTNVKASIEELHGGDEGKVWRWVGGRGAIKA
ncbi:hypothetical protein M422DRAFT_30633 [Sphaerobolus stellatus SS14]|uniref:Man1/Src1 C-terminal domain-containing protein n=1 Tax=Sphaerobolus stellatus (strain SS14) TaxID=990650 RepID=A0A0C9VAV7_SPHS4|nr:hypothetical protein M422DRAFT_30633 [Sphaerobolus stellatus SS14]